ncbi:MAG: hypothetical protein V3S46_02195, partial [Nitrospinota bacterium]
PDMAGLMEIVGQFDKDLEAKFRHLYPSTIFELGSVMVALKKVFTSPSNRKILSARLGETDPHEAYMPRLLNSRKNILVANSLLKNSKMARINLFPFIKLANIELSFILYELSMKLFSLYGNVDKRSLANMLDIQLIFREYHDVKSLWRSFGIFFGRNVVLNFHLMEGTIKMLTKNTAVKDELLRKFPDK